MNQISIEDINKMVHFLSRRQLIDRFDNWCCALHIHLIRARWSHGIKNVIVKLLQFQKEKQKLPFSLYVL